MIIDISSSDHNTPLMQVPSTSVTDNELDDNNDKVDDSCVIELHVGLSKIPCKYSLYLYIYIHFTDW